MRTCSTHSVLLDQLKTDSQFRGSFDRGIAFVGSELTVNACTFDNTVTLLASDPLRGADIHLGSRDSVRDAAMLTNVHHQPSPGAPDGEANSIRWSAGYEARSLVLQGCQFGASVRIEGSL